MTYGAFQHGQPFSRQEQGVTANQSRAYPGFRASKMGLMARFPMAHWLGSKKGPIYLESYFTVNIPLVLLIESERKSSMMPACLQYFPSTL